MVKKKVPRGAAIRWQKTKWPHRGLVRAQLKVVPKKPLMEAWLPVGFQTAEGTEGSPG